MAGKKKVLIVDDARDMLVLYGDILTKAGYEVNTAQTLDACLRIARAMAPDIILMDIVMPDMDGGTMARQVLEDPQLSSIPIVFLTSMISPDEASAAYKPGARMYISKASSPSEIISRVKKVIG